MRIYLDVCCLNRPFDDQSQERIRLETEAITIIFNGIKQKKWHWLGSSAIIAEIRQTPDVARRQAILLLAKQVDESISLSNRIIERLKTLQEAGLTPFDAAHIAYAEAGHADVFLTTDDRLLRRSHRITNTLGVRVINPLTWIQEVMK